MYFIYGSESYLISNEEKRIKTKIGIEPIVFDETSTVSEIIQEIATINMFYEDKLIIIRNGECFKKDEESQTILNIIKNGIEGVQIIFVLNQSKPKTSNPLISFLLSNSITKQFEEITEKQIQPTVKNMIESKGGQISSKALMILSIKLPTDLMIINNEVDKLIMHSLEITEEMVENSVADYTTDNYFALANAIMEKDNTKVFRSYNQRKANGDDPHLLIGQIASVLLLTHKISHYSKQGMSSKEISDKTKIHLFRIKKSKEFSLKMADQELRDLIIKLSILDTDIKTGKIEAGIGLDKFLLEFVK